MVDITNANIEKMYELNGLHEVVVQKGNVGKTYNYALQLLFLPFPFTKSLP